MKPLTKHERDLMYELLTLPTLETLTSRCYEDNYLYGTRQLKYPPEALLAYANAIHQYILSILDPQALSREDYTRPWLTQCDAYERWLTANETRFIGLLQNIAENPPIMQPNELESPDDRDLRAAIPEVFAGTSYMYESVTDFLNNSLSPLRRAYDSRAVAITTEVESMRSKCNKELDDFIGRQLRATRKLVKNYVEANKQPKQTKSAKAPKVDENQKKVKSFLTSPAYNALCANVDLAIKLNTYLRANKLGDNTEQLKPLVQYTERRTEQNAQALVQRAKEVHALTVELSDAFINNFVAAVGGAYDNLTPDTIFDLEDFVNANCLTYEDSTAQRAEIRLTLAQKGLSEMWFDDYTFSDLEIHLIKCLMSLFDGQTISEQSHGAIIGVHKFAQNVYSQVKAGKAYTFSSAKLAQELRKQVQFHTIANGNVDGIVQFGGTAKLDAEQYADYAKDRIEAQDDSTLALLHIAKYGITKVCSPAPVNEVDLVITAQLKNIAFEVTAPNKGCALTKPLQVQLDAFHATDSITEFEVLESLSDEQIQSLRRIPDCTIQQLLQLFVGQPCEAVMLNGELLARTRGDQFVRIVPKVNADGYAHYNFLLINQSVLSGNISTLESLIATLHDGEAETEDQIAEQIEWHSLTLQEELSQLQTAFNNAKEHYENLRKLAYEAFADSSRYETELAYITSIIQKHYFRWLPTISQHHLVAWVYQPEQYKLVSKELVRFNENGGVIDYEVHHVDGDRSNNHPDNLAILSKAENAALTRSSKQVTYAGHQYLSLSAYCAATDAGSLRKLQQVTKDLTLGGTKNYNGRVYTMVAEGKLTASDSEALQQGTQVAFNDEIYPSLTDFARATKIGAGGLRKKLYDMRTTETSDFKWRGFQFEVLDNIVKATKL